jgi:hypothetical protein
VKRAKWIEGRELEDEESSVQYFVNPELIVDVSYRTVDQQGVEIFQIRFSTDTREYLHSVAESQSIAQSQVDTLIVDIQRYSEN